MSRIGKKPVELPKGVSASISGQTIEVKGPKGTRSFTAGDDVTITLEGTTVKVTPGIREDCVYLYHGFGSRNPEMTAGYNKGVDDQSLITKLAVDPETGAHGMRNNFVKLVKAS